MLNMPPIETEHLLVRPFAMEDLPAIHHLLDVELVSADMGNGGGQTLDERRQWLHWTVLNYDQLAALYQPPYSDRAVVLKEDGTLIGACGYVPCLGPYGQVPTLRAGDAAHPELSSTEFGMFWAISPRYQRQGYATEAGGALIDYAFDQLHLGRIIATTTYDNVASMGVMRKLGMNLDQNPKPTPPWLQMVGVLTNPQPRSLAREATDNAVTR